MTTLTLQKNADSHNIPLPPGALAMAPVLVDHALPAAAPHLPPARSRAPEPDSADQPSDSAVSDSLATARKSIPAIVRHRKLRADSFVAKLNGVQRLKLYEWLNSDDSIEIVRAKITAPPPEGFGLEVGPTTLRRVRALVRNSTTCGLVASAMETAQDVIESESAGPVDALREALSLMLYSRAVYAAKQQADPQCLDKLLAAITRVEKLKASPDNRRNSSARNSTPRTATTRHLVELHVTSHPANQSQTC